MDKVQNTNFTDYNAPSSEPLETNGLGFEYLALLM
jgi:hypothetical protein